MNENPNMPAAAGQVYFRDPASDPPPRGVKLLILTTGGVTVVGDWSDKSNYAAWSPMPKRSVQ